MSADDEEIAALVIDNGSGMCKGKSIHHIPTRLEIACAHELTLLLR
jgi:hypothetical protein